MEIVDQPRAVEVRTLLLELVDLPQGAIEATIGCEGLPNRRYRRPTGGVRISFSASVTARPRQDVSTRSARSKRCCSQATATTSTRRPDSRSICQSGWCAAPQECNSVGGSDAGVYVGENSAVLLDGYRHLDVEIADESIGASVVDSFRQ